jgi:GNAT acetyltransferase-like protein
MLFVPRNVTGTPCREVSTPVYLQQWFTDIAAGGDQIRKTVVTEDGKLLGSFSLLVERNGLGMKQGYNLPWAHLSGLSIAEGIDEVRRTRIARQLIRQLPTDVSLFLTLANESDFELFLSEGFQPAMEENYFISPDRLPALHASFSKMTKRHIKQAQRDLVVSTTTPDSFIETYAVNLARRRRKPYAPLDVAREVLTQGLRREQASIFIAKRRDNGKIDAAIACLRDHARYYYWMTTRRVEVSGEDKSHQGAVKLLLWSAIQDAAARGLIFDFDGAGADLAPRKEGRTRLYSGMGAQDSVRYAVKRETKLERVLGRFRSPIKRAIRKTVGKLMPLRMNH